MSLWRPVCQGSQFRIGALIHEASHHYGTTDHAYGAEACRALPADKALENADSYFYLVQNLNDFDSTRVTWETQLPGPKFTSKLMEKIKRAEIAAKAQQDALKEEAPEVQKGKMGKLAKLLDEQLQPQEKEATEVQDKETFRMRRDKKRQERLERRKKKGKMGKLAQLLDEQLQPQEKEATEVQDKETFRMRRDKKRQERLERRKKKGKMGKLAKLLDEQLQSQVQ